MRPWRPYRSVLHKSLTRWRDSSLSLGDARIMSVKRRLANVGEKCLEPPKPPSTPRFVAECGQGSNGFEIYDTHMT